MSLISLFDLSMHSLLLFLPLFILLLRSCIVVVFNKRLSHLPPSPPKLPIIGSLHQLSTLPHRSLRALADKHGPLMLLHLGGTPTLVASSTDAAREIMKTNDLVFASRPYSKVAKLLLSDTHDLAFAPYGDYWRQAGTAVNMSEVLNSFANDVVCRVVTGKFFRKEGRNVMFGKLIEENSALLGKFHIEDYLPSLAWLDVFFGLNTRAKRNSKRWDDVLGEAVEEHAHRTRAGEGPDQENDFVDVLLSLQKDPNLDFSLTKEHIRALLMDMLAAGTDTSYILLEWAMAELIRSPKAMRKLQEEVRGEAGREAREIKEEDLSESRYLKAVLKETLRLHPPVPLLIPRESTEDCKIQGYSIPKQTKVIINAWAISRDPKQWEEPEEFRPERFMDSSAADFRGNDFRFIPFGAGRRICPASTSRSRPQSLRWRML